MNMPMNYEERINIVDRCTNQELFTFDEILDYKKRNMLEFGDLFIIDNNGEYWHNVVYIYDMFCVITGDYQIVRISEEELSKYKFYNKNLMGNPYQEFKKREKDDKVNFEELSMEDKCDVLVGNYFTKRINETLDGLKSTLQDLVDTLKEE